MSDLAYAGDICLISDDLRDLRRMTETMVWEAVKFGLRVNTRKLENTKIRIDNTSQIDIG